MLWLHGGQPGANPNRFGMHFLTVFFAVLLLAELVKTVTQLMSYRRSM